MFYKLQFMVHLYSSCDFSIPDFPACSVAVNNGVFIYDKTIHSTCGDARSNILLRLKSEAMY